MAEEQNEKDSSTEETPAPKSSLKWVIIGCLVVVLGAGGFLGWKIVGSNDTGPEGAEQVAQKIEKQEEEERIVCPLESFIVNLVDKAGTGKRYLKVTVELEVGDETGKKSLNIHQSQLRDTILLLLSGLSFGEINSIEGKLDLKQALLSRINQVLGGGIVRRIYFTEFVVQ